MRTEYMKLRVGESDQLSDPVFTTALLWLHKAEKQGNEGAIKILKAMESSSTY